MELGVAERLQAKPTMVHEDQDALLQRYLGERDPTVAQACLEGLLSEYVEPVVRDITRYKSRLNSSHEAQDEEDIRSEVVLQLIWRLRDLRSSGLRTPIENFRGYVATMTYNAYYKYVRMKYPVRSRLKNRLRYLFNHRPDFAIWENESQEYFCGLAAWRRKLLDRNIDLGNHQLDSSEFLNSLGPGGSVARLALPELVNKFLTWRGQPILLDELVGIVAELQGIRDLQPLQVQSDYGEEGDSASICELLPDTAVDIASTVERRFFLERLWKEVCQLPQRQRVALLLNLRDAQARDALILFTLTGIASLRRIAEALEMPPEELVPLWNELPLEDTAIARRLGITRQQVINLRKSARERLVRRMLAWGGSQRGGEV